VTVAEVPDASGASDHPYRLGNVARPIFHGALGFAFLVLCGVAADRAKKRKTH
jgi:hypothetical protein